MTASAEPVQATPTTPNKAKSASCALKDLSTTPRHKSVSTISPRSYSSAETTNTSTKLWRSASVPSNHPTTLAMSVLPAAPHTTGTLPTRSARCALTDRSSTQARRSAKAVLSTLPSRKMANATVVLLTPTTMPLLRHASSAPPALTSMKPLNSAKKSPSLTLTVQLEPLSTLPLENASVQLTSPSMTESNVWTVSSLYTGIRILKLVSPVQMALSTTP